MRSIFLIRHAEAEEAIHATNKLRSDARRRLTYAGRRDMLKGARGLTKLVDDLSLILSSPLTRATETAEIINIAFPRAEVRRLKLLEPGFDPNELFAMVTGEVGPLALVGHEPDLSQWIGYLATGSSKSPVRMKKGSICRLDMPVSAVPGEARIAWLITLKQLMRLS